MNRNTIFLISLLILISLDVISTFVGINYFGGIELNPIFYMVGGLTEFLLLKIIFSIIGISIIYKCSKTNIQTVNQTAYITLLVLNSLYGYVIISNSYQLYQIIEVL